MAVKMHLPPLDVTPFPLYSTSSYASSGLGSPMSPTRAPYIPPPASPDFAGIQKILREALRTSRITLQQLERLPAGIHRTYLLHLTDGSRLILKCPPANGTRLLRSENCALATEAAVLPLLAQAAAAVPAPALIRHESRPNPALGPPYLLRSHLPGTPLSVLRPRLSASALASIDHAVGAHLRSIGGLTARRFGPAHAVLAGRGAVTWREAFLLLLEATLRDAEDCLVAIPYDAVRAAVGAQAHALDEVRQPRLVGCEVGRAANVLVDERTGRVTGLLGWDSAVWGDPLMAGCVVCEDGASASFLEGLGVPPVRTGGERARLLMYAVYRAVVAVVTQYYRPQNDEELGEFEARRALSKALNELAAV